MTAPIQIGRASSAASTAFCAEHVSGPGGYLVIDGNQKITRGNGTYAAPRPNALSLLAGNTDAAREHCPGSTPTCRASCYVHGIEAHASPTYAAYAHNSEMLRWILGGAEAIALLWAQTLGDWIAASARGGFRWHVSGDVFSLEHARWIADVVRASAGVEHWIYTRSLAHAEPLVAVSRGRGGALTLNFSCDADNYAEARAYWERLATPPYHWTDAPRLCYLTTDGAVPGDLPPGSVVFPDYPLRAAGDAPSPWYEALPKDVRQMVCPADHRGKSEVRRCGVCVRCLT